MGSSGISAHIFAVEAMAPLAEGWDYGSWSAVYNALSFGIAAMGSATIFFWLQLPNISKKYRTALIITGLVTLIATYHYFRFLLRRGTSGPAVHRPGKKVEDVLTLCLLLRHFGVPK